MKLAHPDKPERFEPLGQDHLPEHKRVAYLLAAPGLYAKAEFERAIRRAGGCVVREADLLAALEDGLAALLGDPDDAATLAIMQGHVADYRARIEAASPDEAVLLVLGVDHPIARVREIVARGHARYNELEADREFYWEARGIEAARLFVVDWENGPAPFRRGPRGVPDSLLALIPEGHRTAIGFKAGQLFQPTLAEVKNSASPSPGSSSGTPSSSEATASAIPRKGRGKRTTGNSRKSRSHA